MTSDRCKLFIRRSCTPGSSNNVWRSSVDAATHSDTSIGQNNGSWGAAGNGLPLQRRLLKFVRDIVNTAGALLAVPVKARKAERVSVLCKVIDN